LGNSFSFSEKIIEEICALSVKIWPEFGRTSSRPVFYWSSFTFGCFVTLKLLFWSARIKHKLTHSASYSWVCPFEQPPVWKISIR
jgi:hypothetical protein